MKKSLFTFFCLSVKQDNSVKAHIHTYVFGVTISSHKSFFVPTWLDFFMSVCLALFVGTQTAAEADLDCT